MTKYKKVHEKKHSEHYAKIKEKWEEFEKEYWRKYPEEKYCHVCGEKKNVELHHIIPRHIAPDKIFDESNLIPLCRHDHLVFGHLGNFEWWNPHIREDAEMLYNLLQKRRKEFEDKHPDIVHPKVRRREK